ncbi:Fic family protein [Stenotrophomonas maltophilia]|uniref:Fic family protein n=1 Tax=Stenotrophomonas maltophilia TaxID=40324 RepID=UPI0039C25162
MYGLPSESLALLSHADFSLDVPAAGDSASFNVLCSRVANCRFRYCPECRSDPAGFLKCRRGAAFAKACQKSAKRGFGSPQLRVLHSAAAPDAVRSGNFRTDRVWVGKPGDPHAIIASRIDVEAHIKELKKLHDRLHLQGRIILLVFMMTMLHPFEDGNGRTMRALMLAMAAGAGGHFLSFFALYLKAAQQDMVLAVNLLADSQLGPMLELIEKSREFYSNLICNGSGAVLEWVRALEDEKLVARQMDFDRPAVLTGGG